MGNIGAPKKIRKFKVEAAINVLKCTPAVKFGISESLKKEKIEWLKTRCDERTKLKRDKSDAAKERKKKLKRMFESKIEEYFYKRKDNELIDIYEKEKNKLYNEDLKKKGKDSPQIRISRSSKNNLDLIAKITELKSPARVIVELLKIFESNPSSLLKTNELRKYKKKKSKHNM